MIKRIVFSVPKFGDKGTGDVARLQEALNEAGFPVKADDDFGPLTRSALAKFQEKNGLRGSGAISPDLKEFMLLGMLWSNEKLNAPWLDEAKKMEGQRETNPTFAKKMVAKWKLVGLSLKTIATSKTAWCGLFIAVALSGAGGYQIAKNGGTAKSWDSYGQEIDWRENGIPQGAIIRINHKANCKSTGSNHVTFANGSCSAKDITKSGATFAGFGGNQGNMAKVSSYPAAHICQVRWPNEDKLPPPVSKSEGCTVGANPGESTR